MSEATKLKLYPNDIQTEVDVPDVTLHQLFQQLVQRYSQK